MQNVQKWVQNSFLSSCTHCCVSSHKVPPSAAEGGWAANEFALMTALRVPGLHHDLPCLTESIRSPRPAESWAWNPSPAPLQSVQTAVNTKIQTPKPHHMQFHRHTCQFRQEPMSCLTTLHTPSTKCTGSATLRVSVLTEDSLATNKGIFDLSVWRS